MKHEPPSLTCRRWWWGNDVNVVCNVRTLSFYNVPKLGVVASNKICCKWPWALVCAPACSNRPAHRSAYVGCNIRPAGRRLLYSFYPFADPFKLLLTSRSDSHCQFFRVKCIPSKRWGEIITMNFNNIFSDYQSISIRKHSKPSFQALRRKCFVKRWNTEVIIWRDPIEDILFEL